MGKLVLYWMRLQFHLNFITEALTMHFCVKGKFDLENDSNYGHKKRGGRRDWIRQENVLW